MRRREIRIQHIPPRERSTLINPGVSVPTTDPAVAPSRISSPQPTPLAVEGSLSQVAWEQLIAQHAATQQLLRAHDQLVRVLRRFDEPAQMEAIQLTQTNPIVESRERFEQPVASIGIYNPSAVNVYFSGTGSATAAAFAPKAPAGCLIVLPIMAQMIEIGAAAADLATPICVFLLRFFTVQAAFLS